MRSIVILCCLFISIIVFKILFDFSCDSLFWLHDQEDIITHHKIGWRTKKTFSRARMSGVIHARSDNMIQSLTKYQHFLFHSMQKNGFRSDQATVADAMGCSVADTHGILRNEKICRKVKEFANILSIGHQKLACLNAGYSEEHCMGDLSCCLTY